ncbi:MAG: SpoIIIAH-like family protein [Oscillospiraceae bacterium]|nr:SpoIIIAH-like family protein [Oscillospiraceae bacterium]
MNFIISKKHIVLASLTLALSIAVYINFVFAKNENKIDMTDTVDSQNTQTSASENYGDTKLVDGKNVNETDGYFEEARLSRTRARDEAIETLQGMFEKITDDEDELAEMTMKAVAIAKSIDAEGKIENLIKAKGFEDCLVYINETKADVIIKTDGLLSGEAAVIKDIILSETELEAENIKILEVN